jgi:hypothetical protein
VVVWNRARVMGQDRATWIGRVTRGERSLEKSPTLDRTGSSPESDGCGATTMVRQMVRHGARGRRIVGSG